MSNFNSPNLPGRTVLINEETHLYFSGTNYLGIAQNKAFKELLKAGIDRYGVHYGGSRLSNIQFPIFEATEDFLQTFTGAEQALIFSSGSYAGQTLLKIFPKDTAFFYTPNTHPAVIKDTGKQFTSKHWLVEFLDYIEKNKPQKIVLVSNSIDPLRATPLGLDWIQQIPKDIDLTLIFDDSHGIGLTGKNGAGIFSTLATPSNINLIVVASLGKAFGIPCGVILGSADILTKLRQSPYFGGSSPPSPAFLHAFLEGQDIYSDSRKKLFENIQLFESAIGTLDLFQRLANYPVFYTAQNDLYPLLLKHQIMISSFPYPRPTDEWITRVVLNALHTSADLEQLVSIITQWHHK